MPKKRRTIKIEYIENEKTTGSKIKQELRANAHETRDSISLIWYAGYQ